MKTSASSGSLIAFLLLIIATAASGFGLGETDQLLFQEHGLVMLLIDPANGRIVDANNRAVAYYGYSYEQLTGMRIQQINTLSESEIQMEMARANRENNNFFVFRHRLADGSIHPVEVYSSPMRRNGQTLLYSVIVDVSQRERLLETVAENESRLRYTEQIANFGYFMLDINTDEYFFSEGAMTVLGLDKSNYQADSFRHMIVPQDRCLLYTSPSPRDRTRSRMPSSA